MDIIPLIKVLAQSYAISKKLEIKKSIRANINSARDIKLPSTSAKNAGRLSSWNKPFFEDYQLSIISSLSTIKNSDQLFLSMYCPLVHFKKMIDWLRSQHFIVIGNQKTGLIVLSWVGSKSWLKSHKLTDKLLESELDRLVSELTEDELRSLLDIKNWYKPKLTSNDPNKILEELTKVIDNMP